MTQPLIAAAMGVSLSMVNRAHMVYDHGGIKALKPKPSGGRKRENIMTQGEEKALLVRFAKAAGAGEMLNIHDLKAAYEKAISGWIPTRSATPTSARAHQGKAGFSFPRRRSAGFRRCECGSPGERKKSIRFKALQVLQFASEFMIGHETSKRAQSIIFWPGTAGAS
jgi:hypothetical protein